MTEKVFGTKKTGSIHDIPLPQAERSSNTLNLQQEEGGDNRDNFDDWSTMKRKNKRSSTKIIIAALVLLGLVGLYSYFFHSATVTVARQSVDVAITSQEFKAQLNPTDGLKFERVDPFEKTTTLYIEGSLQENRQTKSSGIITVFNTDKTVKNYIKNTRFQTEDGRVYRAFKRFVIPAGSADNPGSVDVLITAENPGDKYNSASGLRFTLPALKEQGDASYELVYGRQKEELSGGFSGVIRVPSDDDVKEAQIKLKARLTQELEADFAASLPENYIVNKDYLIASDPEFTQKPNATKGGIDLEARGTLNAVIFKKEIFEKFMAATLVDSYKDGDNVSITNISALTMTINEKDFDPTTVEEFEFTVLGEANFIWDIDQTQVANSVAGKLKSHINNGLVNGLGNIQILEVSVSPFWRRSLPEDSSNIRVTVE